MDSIEERVIYETSSIIASFEIVTQNGNTGMVELGHGSVQRPGQPKVGHGQREKFHKFRFYRRER
jgi:hypothetical protein